MLLSNIIKLRENLDLNLNRVVIGFLISTLIFFTFFFKLELILLLLLILLTFYELYINKIVNSISFILSSFIFIMYFFLGSLLSFHLIYFSIFLILFLFIFQKFFDFIVPIILTIFFIEIHKLILIDRNMFYLLLLVSFINDTSAYFIGKNLGGKLIIPSISPKKTWSGTLGSFSITFIILIFLGFSLFHCFLLSSSLFIGDIFFSLVKRKVNIKDFSNLLNSHGGILDRLDSFILLILLFKFLI